MIEETEGVVAALVERGYRVIGEDYQPMHFGNAFVLLNKGSTNVRIVRDRLQWFAEVAFCGDPDRWFDSSVLFAQLGEPWIEPTFSLDAIGRKLVETLPRWELFFLPETYGDVRPQLEHTQRRLASESRDRVREEFDRMAKKLEDFKNFAAGALAFLVDEYGFELAVSDPIGGKWSATYRRGESVLIRQNYELGAEPRTTVSFPSQQRRLSLQRLAKRSGIAWPEPESDTPAAKVQRDAAVLREWCRLTFGPRDAMP